MPSSIYDGLALIPSGTSGPSLRRIPTNGRSLRGTEPRRAVGRTPREVWERRRIRVLFIGAHIGKGGGLALQTFQIFTALRRHIDVDLLCLDAPGPHRTLLNHPGVHVAGRLEFPKGIASLRDALRQIRDDYDLFQILDPYYALPAAHLAQASPRVVFLGTDPRAELGWRYGPHVGLLTRLAIPPLLAGNPLIVNSQSLATRFRWFHPRVILGGVDAAKFEHLPSKEDARRSLGLRENGLLLATVCKVIPIKRVEWLLEILRRLPDVSAVIVGGYSEEHYRDVYYRRLLAAYPDVLHRVTFTGEVPWAQVSTYLAAADVFVFPSRFEGLPNAVLEAMAAGLPVVASDIPPHHEMIEDGWTGFLASSATAMTRIVSNLAANPDRREKIGAAARAFVREHLSSEACAQAFNALYRRVLTQEALPQKIPERIDIPRGQGG